MFRDLFLLLKLSEVQASRLGAYFIYYLFKEDQIASYYQGLPKDLQDSFVHIFQDILGKLLNECSPTRLAKYDLLNLITHILVHQVYWFHLRSYNLCFQPFLNEI